MVRGTIFLGGNYPRGQLSRGQLSKGQFSLGAIVLQPFSPNTGRIVGCISSTSFEKLTNLPEIIVLQSFRHSLITLPNGCFS